MIIENWSDRAYLTSLHRQLNFWYFLFDSHPLACKTKSSTDFKDRNQVYQCPQHIETTTQYFWMDDFTLLWSSFTKIHGFKAFAVILLEETCQIKAREASLPVVEPVTSLAKPHLWLSRDPWRWYYPPHLIDIENEVQRGSCACIWKAARGQGWAS